MKKKLLILFVFLCFGYGRAQTTAIPDSNFEQALISLGYDDVIDGHVVTSHINAITSLYVANKNITDLTGIQDFVGLYQLWCGDNQLTTLDITHNTALMHLYCDNNQLTALDVSKCASLESLYVGNNQLTSLDARGLTSLTILYASENKLSSVLISGCSSLEKLYVVFNQLESLDVSGFTSLKYLIADGNKLTSLNAQGCSSLEVLNAASNQLENLNVIGCVSMWWLSMSDNQVTNLDVNGCTSLRDLEANHNQLSSIDASGCTALEYVDAYDNQLTNVNTSGCISLAHLDIHDNQLTNIDVSDIPILSDDNPTGKSVSTQSKSVATAKLDAGARKTDFRGNPDLTCIKVSNVELANSSPYWFKNDNASYSLSCDSITVLTTAIPDPNFEQALISLGYDDVLDGQVLTSNISNVTDLDVRGKNITDLTGIKSFRSLQILNCANNQLTSLNLSGLKTLKFLKCNNNQLTSLNLRGLTALTYLYCNNNQLSSIDVSGSTALFYLDCGFNQLTSLDVHRLTALYFLGCGVNQLTSLDVSGLTVLNALNCFNNQLTSLNLSGLTALTSLDCFYNQLKSLDVSGHTSLKYLNVQGNQLESIDVSDMIILTDNSSSGKSVSAGSSDVPTDRTDFRDNPNLTCIKVSNVVSATSSSIWFKNDNASYSLSCGNQPATASICSSIGSTANISVTTDAAAPVFEWQYRVISAAKPKSAWITITSSNAGTVYSNYTTGALTITKTNSLPAVGTQYRAIVTDENNNFTISDVTKLTILSTVKSGTVATMPSIPTVCAGDDITFTLSKYAGTSIQWQTASVLTNVVKGTVADWTDIDGETGSTYTTESLTASSKRYYRAIVINSCNNTTATTATKTITVNPPAFAGTITGGAVVCDSGTGTAKYTMRVTGNVGNIQWQYSNASTDWTDVTSGTSTALFTTDSFTSASNGRSSSYVIFNITADTRFRAVITSGVCSQTAVTDEVRYTMAPAKGGVLVSNANETLCPGTGTSLTLDGSFGTIKWMKSTNYGTMGAGAKWTTVRGVFPNLNTENLTVTTWYKAVVSLGTMCSVESNIAEVAVHAKGVAKAITGNAVVSTTENGKTAKTALCSSDNSKELSIGDGYSGDIQWETYVTDALMPIVPTATTIWTPIDGANQQVYIVDEASSGKNYFRAKFTNGNCATTAVYSAPIAVFYKACGSSKTVSTEKEGNNTSFNVVAYPNPFTDNVNLSIMPASRENIRIMVYDMIGKIIEQRELQPREVYGLQIGNGYSKGVYNIIVTQGTEVKTLRLIKR